MTRPGSQGASKPYTGHTFPPLRSPPPDPACITKICHVLGGKYDLPHAQTHAILLPYVLAFNSPSAPDAERRLAAAFDSDRAIDGLQSLRERLDAPRALRDIGFTEADIPAAAAAICRPSLPITPPPPRPRTSNDCCRQRGTELTRDEYGRHRAGPHDVTEVPDHFACLS